MQTSVSISTGKYTAGLCYSYRERVADWMPLEDIKFGYGLVRSQDQARACRLPNMNKLAAIISVDLVAADQITAELVTIDPDGNESVSSVDETYATSHLATVTAVKDAIEAADSDMTVTLSGSNRTLTIVSAADKRTRVDTAFAITNGGAGTATVASTKGTTDANVDAIAERDPNAVALLALTYTEPYHEAKQKLLSALRRGDPSVPVAGTPVVGGTPYVLLEDYTDTDTILNKRGTFRTDTDSDAAPVLAMTGGEWSEMANAGLAPIALLKA